MPFNTGFRGNVGGSVQTNYTDQPGVGVPGMLAFASDINLADSVFISEDDGIAAGRGVVFEDLDDSTANLQRPNVGAKLPNSGSTVDDFKGIVVFDEQMQSNADGVPGWANGRVGSILRNDRSGGRIYVDVKEAIDDLTAGVHLFIAKNGPHEIGEFGPILIGGSNIFIPNAKWVTIAAVGDIAIIELLG